MNCEEQKAALRRMGVLLAQRPKRAAVTREANRLAGLLADAWSAEWREFPNTVIVSDEQLAALRRGRVLKQRTVKPRRPAR